MRFDLRLRGKVSDGKKCVLEASVYANSLKQLQKRADDAATEGPWYYEGTNEPVAEGAHITVEDVEQLNSKRPRSPEARG